MNKIISLNTAETLQNVDVKQAFELVDAESAVVVRLTITHNQLEAQANELKSKLALLEREMDKNTLKLEAAKYRCGIARAQAATILAFHIGDKLGVTIINE